MRKSFEIQHKALEVALVESHTVTSTADTRLSAFVSKIARFGH